MSQIQPPVSPVPAVPVATAKKRPGGLTALAVLNFVFAGFGIIGAFGLLAMLALVDTMAQRTAGASGNQTMVAAAQQVHMAAGTIYFLAFLVFVAASLLIVSGVGYIKMSKTAGYIVGHIYAFLAILNVVLNLAMTPNGFGFGAIIGLAYPVLTIALLNTSFKKCFA